VKIKQSLADLSAYDTSKMDFWIAARNAVGLGIALTIGLVMREPVLGLLIGLGALNVAFADSRDPYVYRLSRMLASTLFCGLAVLLGSIIVKVPYLVGMVTALWAFGAGMSILLGTAFSDLLIISLTLLIISSTQAVPMDKALMFAGLTVAGGLVQVVMSTGLWTFRRFKAERRALSELYRALARAADVEHDEAAAPFATEMMIRTRDALGFALRSNSRKSDRFKFLLVQGERIRLSLYVLGRLKKRDSTGMIEEYLLSARVRLNGIAQKIADPNIDEPPVPGFEALARKVMEIDLRSGDDSRQAKLQREIRRRLEALGGQLRAARDLAGNLAITTETTPAEAHRPWRLRFNSTLALFGANFNLKSVAFRHATRLAVGVLIGEFLSHALSLHRSYWIPMTIVIVLKPDYSSTFSRGMLRILGTFAGILFSAVLFRYFHMSIETLILCTGGLMFLLRWVGTTNYGVFAFLVANMVVFLFAIEGVAPETVMLARCTNTAIGGAIAMFLYLAWPTREHGQVSSSLAALLNTYHPYFHGILLKLGNPNATHHSEIERSRVESRVARANHEGAIARFTKESDATPGRIALVRSMQASCNRFVSSCMTLDAFEEELTAQQKDLLQEFTKRGDALLSHLAFALDEMRPLGKNIPNLREACTALIATPGNPEGTLETELDKLTNALNTLTEQVEAWIESNRPSSKHAKRRRIPLLGIRL
jgi:uncharacterized membrane protein YccC